MGMGYGTRKVPERPGVFDDNSLRSDGFLIARYQASGSHWQRRSTASCEGFALQIQILPFP
jgi:hypothetical protein